MATQITSIVKNDGRKRKPHRKSRGGCYNCKFRRVKCDEARPSCKKCISYRVSCTYDGKINQEFQLSGDVSVSVGWSEDHHSSPESTGFIFMENPSSHSSPESTCCTNTYDLDTMDRFRDRTVLTMGTTQSRTIYQHEMTKMAKQRPFLMHLALALTMMHDRYLTSNLSMRASELESYHWYTGTALFNNVLSHKIRESDKPAIWSSAAIIGVIVFGSMDATTVDEAWPLAPPSGADLEWLKISDGKKAILQLVLDPQPSSIFTEFLGDQRNEGFAIMTAGMDVDALPMGFIDLYDLTDPTTRDQSPYWHTVRVLSRLMKLDANQTTILKFLSFITNVNAEFRRLLEAKAPKALLLLAWWFALLCPYRQWWIEKRVILQCQAICIYLEQTYPEETVLQNLIQYPKVMCGLSPSPRPVLAS